jgi:hypothetical protein
MCLGFQQPLIFIDNNNKTQWKFYADMIPILIRNPFLGPYSQV